MSFIILCGIKHCGKSTQAKLLSEHLKCNYFDTDDVITKLTGKNPRQIYTENGKEAFMRQEYLACNKIIYDTPDEFAIVATGGGICNNNAAIEVLQKGGKLVFLESEESIAADRIVQEMTVDKDGSIKNLPAYIAKLNPQNESDVRKCFHSFFEERTRIYKQIADLCIQMHSGTKEENMLKILDACKKAGFIDS